MALYIAQLSGESPELGIEELRALFESVRSKFSVKAKFQRGKYILLESRLSAAKVAKLAERSSMLKFVSFVVKELGSLQLLELDKVRWSFVKTPFCVRVVDLTKREMPGLEARLAGPIFDYFVHKGRKQRILVSLEKPKTTVLFLITGKRYFVTSLLWKAPKGRFKKREPGKRPVLHPTTLKPKLARLLVNISRAKPKSVVVDPFCGTGSVLMEASLLGCRPAGIDIEPRMLEMARANLKFYKLKSKLIEGNALELEKFFRKNSVDAIATDPPYGRSTRIGAKNIRELYKGFFAAAHKILKPKRFAAVIYPHYIKAKMLLNKRKWRVTFESSLYVHSGLTRKILVLQKL